MSVVELEPRLLNVKLSNSSLTEDYHQVLVNGQIASEEPLQVVVTDITEEPTEVDSPGQQSGASSPDNGLETSGFFDDNDELNGDCRSPRLADKTQICFDFTKGLCSRGDKCKFSHDIPTIVSFNSKEKGICFDYLRNQCYRGLLCRFSHDLTNIAQQYQIYNNAAKTRATTSICYDFVKGVCQRGSQCKYSHDLSMIAKIGRNNGTNGSNEVCHDFLRGRCTRGAACKYSHNVAFLGAQGLVAAVASPNGGNGIPLASQGSLGSVGLSMGGLPNNLSVNVPVMTSSTLGQYGHAGGNFGPAMPGAGLPSPNLLSMSALQQPNMASHGNGSGMMPDASAGFAMQQPQRMMSGGLADGLGVSDLATAWARATQAGTTNGMMSSFAAPQLQTARTDPTAVINAMNNSMRLMGGGGGYQTPAELYNSITNQAALAHARQHVNMQGLLVGHLNKTASDVSSQLAALRNSHAFNELLESAAHANELEASLRNPLGGSLHRQQSAPAPMPEGLLQSLIQVQQHQQQQHDVAAAAEGLAAAHLAVSQAQQQQQQQQHPRSPMMDHSQLGRQLSGHMGGHPSPTMMDHGQLGRQMSGHMGGQSPSTMMDHGQLSRQLSGHVGVQSPNTMMDHGQLSRQMSGHVGVQSPTTVMDHGQLSRQMSSHVGGQSPTSMMDHGQLSRQMSGHVGGHSPPAMMDPSQLSRQMSGHMGGQPSPVMMDHGQLSRQLSGHVGVNAPPNMMDAGQLTRQLSSQLSAPPNIETNSLSRQLSGQMPSNMPVQMAPHMNGHGSPKLGSPNGPHASSPVAPTQPQPIPQKGPNSSSAAASAPGALNLTEGAPSFTTGASYGDGFMSGGNDSVASTPGEGNALPFQRIKEIWNRGGSYGEA